MTTTHQQTTPPERRRPHDTASRGEARRVRTHELFSLATSTDSVAERRALMDVVIEMHLDLAHAEAARYRNRGIPLDDLRQVAALALTKATRGYDVSTGHEFLSYAVPTIRGELRKHFRDHGWMVRPPRRIQELQARITAAREELSFKLGRSPQPSDIADHLDERLESVIEAVASDGCFVPASLDHPVGTDEANTLGDLLPDDTSEFEASDARTILLPLLEQLPERDRLILYLRFYEGLTQREIGARLHVSQMQVSRLMARIIAGLRKRVDDGLTR